MLKFLLGVVVGVVGYWAYRFWKGDEDASWEQPFLAEPTDATATGGSASADAQGGSGATPAA